MTIESGPIKAKKNDSGNSGENKLAPYKVYTMDGTIFYLSEFSPFSASGITYKNGDKVSFNSDMIIAVVERKSS